MLRASRRILRLCRRLRIQLWVLSTVVRLRSRGCTCRIELGRRVRLDSRPLVRVMERGAGSVTITIGDDVDLGCLLLIDVDARRRSTLTIGAGTTFEHAVRIQLFGGDLVLGPSCEVRDGAVLKVSNAGAELTIGEHVKIGRSTALHCHESVVIEDFVTIAERATIIDSFHDVDGSDVWTMEQPVGSAPVRVERNAMILSGAVVVHGTTLGRSSVVSANALVAAGSTHAAGAVLVGNPARTVRRLEPLGDRSEEAKDGASDA